LSLNNNKIENLNKCPEININIHPDENDKAIETTKNTDHQRSYHYSFCNILSIIGFEFINGIGSLTFFGVIFTIMNLSLFTTFPLAVVLNILYNFGYLFFIIISVYSGLRARECGYSYLPLSPVRRVLEFIKQVLLDILVFALGLIVLSLVFAIGNGIYIIFEILSFAILLLGQSLLWPVVETIKFYRNNNKIIGGYGHGVIKEKIIYNENKKIQGITETDKDENNNSNNTKPENNTIKDHNDPRMDISNSWSSLYSIRDIIFDDTPHPKLIIPSLYFKHRSFSNLVFQIWKYRIKRLLILCLSWNKLSLYPFGLFFMMFPNLHNIYQTNGFEGVRFLWWHKKTILEQPKFNKTELNYLNMM